MLNSILDIVYNHNGLLILIHLALTALLMFSGLERENRIYQRIILVIWLVGTAYLVFFERSPLMDARYNFIPFRDDNLFNIKSNTLSVCTPLKLRIQAVSVVPIFEPIMIPTVCASAIIPEFTNPTNITVNAEEDCIAIVITAPNINPFNGLSVIFFKTDSSLSPATFFNPDESTVIPNKKNANPPMTEI